MYFRSTNVIGAKKADNGGNFAAGGIINRRTHHKRQEQTLGDQLRDSSQDKRVV
jgi:hypothetical protein